MNNQRRHIPAEIVETILMHLPIKPLYRFSRVSKSWKSLIFEPNFMKKRAAVRDPRRVLMSPLEPRPFHNPDLVLDGVTSCSLSSIYSGNEVADATPIIFPIEGNPILLASSGELWCVAVNNSLYLWNPSINICKKIPNSSIPSDSITSDFVYGLGYDSVSDDYKILTVQLRTSRNQSEVYSLRSDSWRSIHHQPRSVECIRKQKCASVNGALHWWTYSSEDVLFFDLATENYGNIAAPPEKMICMVISVAAFGGKLCVLKKQGLAVWVMEEYGLRNHGRSILIVRMRI